MFVNNKKTGSRGIKYKDGNVTHMIKAIMPFIPRTDEYYDRYAVLDKKGKIVEIRTRAQDEMEKHTKWLNKLYGNEKTR